MELRTIGGRQVLEYQADDALLATTAQVIDLIGEAYGREIDLFVIPAERLAPEFFVLRSGFAGEVFQKFQTYGQRLVIMGDISAPIAASTALRDFVRETNRVGNHLFVADEAALLAAVQQSPQS